MGLKMSPFFCLFIFFSVASSTLTSFDVSPFLPLFGSGTTLEIVGFMNMYRNNTIQRLDANYIVPPSSDPKTGVNSKDVVISPQNGVSARLYIPNSISTTQQRKLPLVIYFHGGGFCTGSPFSPTYHNYLNSLVAAASVVAMSVNYRVAPENSVPAAYQDSWSALNWVAKHSNGGGNEAWLNDYVDFQNVYLSGDSAGANIAHNVAMLVGQGKFDGLQLAGVVLISPYFWGEDPIGENEPKGAKVRTTVENLWHVATGMRVGLDSPWANPLQDPSLSKLGCIRVLVCIAEFDWLRDRGEYYYNALGTCGWKGQAELYETTGEGHVFHLNKPDSYNAKALLKKVVSFINTQS